MDGSVVPCQDFLSEPARPAADSVETPRSEQLKETPRSEELHEMLKGMERPGQNLEIIKVNGECRWPSHVWSPLAEAREEVARVLDARLQKPSWNPGERRRQKEGPISPTFSLGARARRSRGSMKLKSVTKFFRSES